MRRIISVLAAPVAAIAVLAGCGGPKVAARVNKDTITVDDFYSRMAQVDAVELSNSAQARGPARAGEYAMRALLVEKLILQLAASKGATPTDAEVNEYLAFARKYPQAVGASPYRSEEMAKREARLQVAMRNLMAKPLNITDADIQAEYDRIKSRLVEPKQYRLRIVEVNTEAKAKAAAEKLAKGISFETVALTDSDDPALRSRSGDAGYLPEPAMPPVLRNAVKSLKPGEYTKQPIRVDAPAAANQPSAAPHWFLAQVVEIKEARQIPLSEVKYDVMGRVINAKDPTAGQRVMVLLRDFAKSATIEIQMKGYEDIGKQLKESAAAAVPAPAQPAAPAPAGAPGGR